MGKSREKRTKKSKNWCLVNISTLTDVPKLSCPRFFSSITNEHFLSLKKKQQDKNRERRNEREREGGRRRRRRINNRKIIKRERETLREIREGATAGIEEREREIRSTSRKKSAVHFYRVFILSKNGLYYFHVRFSAGLEDNILNSKLCNCFLFKL